MAKRLADETGILVAGKDRNGRGYVLADRPGRYPPTEWARVAISLYGSHAADRIVAERNNGGDMVEATIRMVNPNVPVTTVWASRGKSVRAEPVAALYEQNKIHHVGTFAGVCARQPRVRETTAGRGEHLAHAFWFARKRTALPRCRLRQSQARSDRSPRAAANP